MEIIPTPQSIADYCKSLSRKEIIVNRQYQRNNKVWPEIARSFLIETILLGYPIPKFFLYQKVDRTSKSSYREIVDGQQRTMAIEDFFNNQLRMSKKSEHKEFAGLTYDELPEQYQDKFLGYILHIDLFASAANSEVHEVFRRMNSFTYPLNPEEQRHANFQGEFKWLINALIVALSASALNMKIFNDNNIVRMLDAKLYTEIIHAVISGIETTNKKKLDDLYKKFDDNFERADELKQRLIEAFDMILTWTEIHGTQLVKHYSIYSLVLAIMHLRNPEPTLQKLWNTKFIFADRLTIIRNFGLLSEMLELGENAPETYRKVVTAFSERTNVKEQREIRFRWFCEALTGEL